MKAAFLEKIGDPLTIDNLEPMETLDTGQVLVNIKAASICGKQLGEISGHYGPDKYLPHLMGHEGAGIVADIGPGVTKVKIGDKVVMHWRKGSGIDAKPYRWHRPSTNSFVGSGQITTFSEQSVVSENRLTPYESEHLTFPRAALLGCALTTGFGIIFREANVKKDETVAIIGAGGVGMSVIQAAKLRCAKHIVAVDTNNDRRLMANNMGADGFVDADTLKLLPSFDVVVDTVGTSQTIDLAIFCVKPQGRIVFVSPPSQYGIALQNFHKLYSGVQIIFSQGGQTVPDVDIPRYIEYIDAGLVGIKDMLGKPYSLDQINEAIDDMKLGRIIGRCIIVMDGH